MLGAVVDQAFTAYTEEGVTGLVGTIGLTIQDEQGNVVAPRTVNGIAETPAGSGVYAYTGVAPLVEGSYLLVWDTGGGNPQYFREFLQVAAIVSEDDSLETTADLTDLMVLVPWAKRACEGPYGAPLGLGELQNAQLYPMVADACSEIILLSGSLFGHELSVKARDLTGGFPTAWRTDTVLNQWEGAVIITQVALDYLRFLYRDMKTSLSIANEGTEYSYTLSASVIAAYLKQLQSDRDRAIDGLRAHNVVLDRYASNIRVRDQATVAILEWWDTNEFDGLGGSGLPGGQEAAVIPWTPGWSGPGFVMGY
jgi:hypothetical protein